MIIELMHYNFKLLANKVESLYNKDFLPNEIDEFLNQAIVTLVNQIYSGYNIYNAEAEDNQFIIDKLDTLVQTESLTPSSNSQDKFYFNLGALSKDYMHFLRCSALADACITMPVTVVKHNELDSLLQTYDQKPSIKWRRVLATFGQNNNNRSLILHTGGEFAVTSVNISYVAFPDSVAVSAYADILNNVKVKTQCNLPDSMHLQVVEKAVQIAQGVLENPTGYQVSTTKTKEHV